MRNKFLLIFGSLLAILPILTWQAVASSNAPQAATYYVSSSGGNDENNGLSQAKPFRTIGKVNNLDLHPGDRVLFQCGDTWQAEPLVITQSGSAAAPVTFSSYPAGCADQPLLSGTRPISGWSVHSGQIYKAALPATAFPYGLNQLFRRGQRLPMGRWPNLDAPDGGYAKVDGQPGGTQLIDQELPPGVNWAGAVLHIKSMRWSVLNRQVTGSSGTTLNLGAGTSCWDGCSGWGYFLNNHLATLDRDGEWHVDHANRMVYLYSSNGTPDQVEGSVIIADPGSDMRNALWGGIMLNAQGNQPLAYVVVENFAVRGWYLNGIAAPIYQRTAESHDLIIRNNTISDVDAIGIRLATWVGDSVEAWRGGDHITVSGNTITGANQIGIDSYAQNSAFLDNTIRDVGLVENWGAAGMGCGYNEGDASGGICTEDGDGIRLKMYGAPDQQSHHVTVKGNRLERIAYGGIQIFGHDNTIAQNVIIQSCYVKGDCGGITTYGGTDLASSPVYNLVIRKNIVVETIGNTNGCLDKFDDLFGFGLYLGDARNTTIDGNTVISSTVHGLLLMNASGTVTGNTFYANGIDRTYDGSQVYLGSSPSAMSAHTGNVLFGLLPYARTLTAEESGSLGTSDGNYFFNPYMANHIYAAGGGRSLASWRAISGKDAHSKENWYTQPSSQLPRSRILYNDGPTFKTIYLGNRTYLDLDQKPVLGSITLNAYTSRVLVDNGDAGLQLLGISPALWGTDAPADFTLRLHGTGFTANSIVRWNGSDRPTTFLNTNTLTASISASDVRAVAQIPVTVYDSHGTPTQTAPRNFQIVEKLWQISLPLVVRGAY